MLKKWSSLCFPWDLVSECTNFQKLYQSMSKVTQCSECTAALFTIAKIWKQPKCVHACMLSHVWLFSDPTDCSPPGSSIHGIFKARTPDWNAISYSKTLCLRQIINKDLLYSSYGSKLGRVDSLEKDPDTGKDWRQEEKGTTEDEMVGWPHWLSEHELEQAPGVGDGEGSLACYNP